MRSPTNRFCGTSTRLFGLLFLLTGVTYVHAATYRYQISVNGAQASVLPAVAPSVVAAPVPNRSIAQYSGYRAWSDASLASSCKGYITAAEGYSYTGAVGDGVYRIQTAGGPINAYCDMTSAGGGWTRVAQQYEATPTSWAGGVNGATVVLAANNIPSHTQTAFGKDNVAIATDYVNFVYTTGDIAKTLLVGLKAGGRSYHIHRSGSGYHNYHNPEESYNSSVQGWRNTLTFYQTGGRYFTWVFSPYIGSVAGTAVGYAWGGDLQYSSQSFAWTVWVR